jgi:rhodanese-related sulfurtransferase
MGQGRAVPVCKAFARGCAWSMITAKARHVYPRANHIPFDEFRALMLNDARRSSSTLLDVRSLEEYSVSHLRGAVWADEKCTSYELATLLPDCDRPIYCYCSFGFRSGRVAEILQEMGYRNVYNVEGALFMWLNTGGDVWRGQVREGASCSVVTMKPPRNCPGPTCSAGGAGEEQLGDELHLRRGDAMTP